jgi:hypothetical protein
LRRATIAAGVSAGTNTPNHGSMTNPLMPDLHGAYADGSSTDSTSVDLCKDKNVNLVE